MKRYFRRWIAGFPALLLAPYLCTTLMFGTETALMTRRADPELILPVFVAEEIREDYQEETIKVQTIIARSNLYRKLQNGVSAGIVPEIYHRPDLTDFIRLLRSIKVYAKAVQETEDQVLTWQKELCLVPYCEMSNGRTRDGAEAFHDENYRYLVSVDSSADQQAPDFLSGVFLNACQLPEELKTTDRDSSGYAQSVRADGKILEAEAFRQGMGLISSDFSIYKTGDRYRILCRGKGHGLGFSQYGGNELAKDGADCQEILNTYFPRMELSDIHTVFQEM